jgi:hypothetical protein
MTAVNSHKRTEEIFDYQLYADYGIHPSWKSCLYWNNLIIQVLLWWGRTNSDKYIFTHLHLIAFSFLSTHSSHFIIWGSVNCNNLLIWCILKKGHKHFCKLHSNK